ncbi:DNA/RNA polymerase [Phytophthora cinnamomi]|uniref:DNA/RNA polymerase n=1 Tax=Phytophthora cinnamomi TaxID=4785 RepID=UPI00355A1AB6|nr:DNA/RNA polymerase [Phytophthora cinnamomi]
MCRMQTRARDIALDTMALEGLVDNTAPTDQDWGGSDTVHGGIDSPDTIFKTKNLTPAYWQLPLSSSGAQVLAFKTLGVYSRLSRVPAGAHAAATENADAVERHETRTALPSLRLHDSSAVQDMLDSKLAAARAKGLAFLDRHTAKLLEFGLVFLNHRSRWASTPRIVRKKEQDSDPTADPRMTIDTRGVNERTEAMPWPMPVLEVVLGALEGAKVFFALDWFRGYWQLPLHEDSQELFTFITHRGMYTPTRVPMGAIDAVAYCQGVVEEIFGDLLGNGILAWLDDILGYAESEDELLQLLDQVLARCEAYGLKLHAKKCDFFEVEVKWCGKMVSAAGVRHCPDRVQGLVEMQPPQTAGDLQQFLCAVNWMRQSIPEYNRLTAGLYAVLEEAMKAAELRKKVKLAKFPLHQIGWGDPQLADLAAVKAALLKMVPLAHPSLTAEVCLYTDASQDSWGAVATQLEPGEVQLPLEQQHHRPLAFLSGRFVGASSRWPTIEKEAYAIVEATRRLEYLLLRPGGFRLYTDHRNLVYIFAPYGPDTAMARYQADKLQRWALSLLSFTYVIEHVPDEANVWGDLLSRWGATKMPTAAPTGARMSRLAAVERVSPLEAVDFVWPSEDEIRTAQLARRAKASMEPSQPPLCWSDDRQLFLLADERVWILWSCSYDYV